MRERIVLRSVELSVSHQLLCGYPLHVPAVILSLLIITTILHGFCSQDMLCDMHPPFLYFQCCGGKKNKILSLQKIKKSGVGGGGVEQLLIL